MSTDGTDARSVSDNEPDRSASMRLRAERPRVTRLSRKVLAGAAAFGSAAIFGATFWALQNDWSHTSAPSELYTTDHHNVADGLAGLPRDYAGVPRQAPPLGPALPGDLGRPILNAQNAPTAGAATIDGDQQRLDQEGEAARLRTHIAASANFPVILLSIVWSDLTTRGAVSGSLAGLLSSVGLVALSPGVWTATLKLGPAPFPYDNPALVSVPLAFAVSWAVSVLDRSSAATLVRASFGAQHVRAQTGLGIE